MRPDSDSDSNEPSGFGLIFRSLKSRNYRLFFAGQGISLIGTWMQGVALSWLVYSKTNSPFMLGLVGFSSQIASFVLTPFAGVVADRLNRRRIIITTQTLAMLQAFALAALVLTGTITIWQIIALSAFIGLVNAFDMPTRQSFLLDMTESKEDLVNAIALNSSIFNMARLVGPSVAGVLIAAVGEGMCFLLNGVSYIAVIISLLAMRIAPRERPMPAPESVVKDFVEGFHYSFGFPPIRAILLLLGLVSLVGMPYTVLMPVFARDILHGNALTLGYLMAATGIGALIGAVLLAARKTVLGLGKWIPTAAVIFGAGLIAFAFSTNLLLSLFVVLVAGFGMIVNMAASNTVLQTIVDEHVRGRVMSFYTVAFVGTAPFGSLLSGALASHIGPQYTMAIGGIICVIGAVLFAVRLEDLRQLVRPIYQRLGIYEAIESGVQAASVLTTPPEEQA